MEPYSGIFYGTRVHGPRVPCKFLYFIFLSLIAPYSILRKLSYKKGAFLGLVWEREQNTEIFAQKGHLPILAQYGY